MMKETELRIGNTIALGEAPITVNLTTLERIVTNNPKYYGHYNPIPITEERILNYGFELMKETEYTLDTFELNGVKLWFPNRNKHKTTEDIEATLNNYKMKYIHQLQNFYFAKTYEELETKL